MAENKKRARVVTLIVAVVAFLVSSWLITNWDDFKAGLLGDSQPQAKR